jgi:hypothetical protein
MDKNTKFPENVKETLPTRRRARRPGGKLLLNG